MLIPAKDYDLMMVGDPHLQIVTSGKGTQGSSGLRGQIPTGEPHAPPACTGELRLGQMDGRPSPALQDGLEFPIQKSQERLVTKPFSNVAQAGLVTLFTVSVGTTLERPWISSPPCQPCIAFGGTPS